MSAVVALASERRVLSHHRPMTTLRPRRSTLFFLLAAVAACGAPQPSTDAATDAASEASADAADPLLRSTGDGLPPVRIDTPIEIDPCADASCTGGRDAQIHGVSLFDGRALWIAYSATEGGSASFATYVTRMTLDLRTLIAPTRVSTSAGNSIDPEIARSPNGPVMVAWTTDDGSGGSSNLQINLRTIDPDTGPLGAGDRRLQSQFMGAPVGENHMVNAVVAMGAQGFAVAGVRATPGAMAFQSFAQRVTTIGELMGDALAPQFDATESQGPTVATYTATSALRLAYERGTTQTTIQLAGSDLATPARATDDGAAPTLASDAQRTAVAFTQRNQIVVQDISAPAAPQLLARLGTGGVHHAPRLAMDGRGNVAVVYFKNISGIRNHVWVAKVTAGGATPVTRQLSELPGAPPYQPCITHIAGDIYFVLWSEGAMSPHFRLRGRFIELR